MKLRFAFLLLLATSIAVVPGAAQTLYSNGPVNGTTDGWTINGGFVVSDTIRFASQVWVGGVNFYAWTFPGDVLENVEVSITSSEFGGTIYTNQIVDFEQFACSTNQFGFNVCLEQSSGMTGVHLNAGTYWLNLANAVLNGDDPIYWDENSGPSQASENSVGTIPSEAFTILACEGCGNTSGTVPEPGGIILFATALIGMAGVIQRKLF